MEESGKLLDHDVVITSRKKIQMTGINDVTSFDEGQVMAQNTDSDISIEGENLKIERFDAENGELIINGTINGLFYYVKKAHKPKKSLSSVFN